MEDFASVVPGSSVSQSPLSEPPDIRNWFPNYVYESVPLNSLVKESETEEDQFCVEEADKENVGAMFGSNKDSEPRNKRLSQDPDGKRSESLPSEPPDIGNWFSSYVYESPVLDTSDGLVLSLPGESEGIKERRNTKDIENEEAKPDRSNISLVESEHEPFSSSKATDFSQSPSMLSEPPNVRIWFSSYEYECPQLSETHELGFASPEMDQLIIEESDTEDENSFGIFRKPRSKKEIIFSDGLKSSGYKKNISEELAKESTEPKENGISDSTHSDKTLEKKSSKLCNPSTEEMKEGSSFSHGSSPCNPKPQSNSKHEGSLREPKSQSLGETVNVNSGRKSPRKATPKPRLFDNLECMVRESDDKENVHRQSTETGFVTTRKDRSREATEQKFRTKPDAGNLVECSRVKGSVKISGEGDEETKKRRRVLGETTNVKRVRSMEMTGKWVCPQKKKPNLAPPLKQLRLDAWVHRV